MADTLMPGDILTEPHAKIVFNAPFAEKHVYHIKVVNNGGRRIGWAIKTTNMQRLSVDPPCGVLDPKEGQLMAVSCEPLNFASDNTSNDRITVEWTNTPDGAAKQFRREWFHTECRGADRIDDWLPATERLYEAPVVMVIYCIRYTVHSYRGCYVIAYGLPPAC